MHSANGCSDKAILRSRKINFEGPRHTEAAAVQIIVMSSGLATHGQRARHEPDSGDRPRLFGSYSKIATPDCTYGGICKQLHLCKILV